MQNQIRPQRLLVSLLQRGMDRIGSDLEKITKIFTGFENFQHLNYHVALN